MQQLQKLFQLGLVGAGPERRNLRELCFHQRLHLRFFLIDLAFVTAELKVHGSRRAGGGDAERLAHHVGKALDRVDGRVPLRHRLERRHVVDLLVDLAELGLRIAATGECDHR